MKLAFVFPGQGSQSIGMMDPFANVPSVRDAFAEASAAINQDLWALVANGPIEALSSTVNTQPVMLAANVALYRAWLAADGAAPSVAAGHSLGEYAALCAAGSFTLADATKLVRLRAQAMQSAVPEGIGAMAAILGLSDDDVRAACLEAAQGDVVEAVNFNAPSQVVIAGHREAVNRAIEIAKSKGAKRGVLLPVSAPFHSSLLIPAAQILAKALISLDIHATNFPVIHNTDVAISGAPDSIRAALAAQAASAVRWVETIEKMSAMGVTHMVECGPGKVLAGLVKRIAPQIQLFSLTDSAALAAAIASTQGASS